MNKRFTFLVLLICLACITTSAQTVEWGNPQKVKSKAFFSQIIGENSSGLFVVRAKNNSFRSNLIIEKYKYNLTLETSKEIEQQSNSLIERIIVNEEGLMVFYIIKNAETKKQDLILTQYRNDLTIENTKTILTFEGVLDVDSKLLIKQSVNKKLFSVIYINSATEKTNSVFNTFSFDNTFAVKYNRKYSLPYTIKEIKLKNVEISNSGNVYALLNVEEKNKRDRFLKYYLYAYTSSTDNMVEYGIGNDSTIVTDAELIVNNYTNTINVSGFYSNKFDNKVLGTFYYLIDGVAEKIEHYKTTPINHALGNKIMGAQFNDGASTLSDLVIRKLIANSDGGCTIVAEKYTETKQSYTYMLNGFPQTGFRTLYTYGEVLLLAKNADGTDRFNQLVKKNQSSLADGGYYSSFVTLLSNDKIGIIYNSDVVNEGDVILATINNKGDLDTKVLIKSVSYYATILPFESKQVSAKSAVISTLKDRRFTLMRLTF